MLRIEDPALDASIVVVDLLAGLLERCDNVGLPIVLDQSFKIFSISGRGVWNFMVGQPSFELSLVPFVVCY